MPITTILIRIAITIAILIFLDFYAFSGIKAVFSGFETEKSKKLVYFIYWGITTCYIAFLLFFILTFDQEKGARGWLFRLVAGGLILIWLPKLLFCVFLIFEDIFRFFNGIAVFVYDKMGWEARGTENYFPERRAFFNKIAFGIAAIPFFATLYGITKGKYDFSVKKITMKFKNLPKSFDGFTITQISDVHSGSFDSMDGVQKGINLINKLKSDVVLFTGDLVNNRADEFDPYISLFGSISAPLGKFSIMGNHDYGEYIPWESAAAKRKNFESLVENHGKAGFKILLNENTVFSRGDDKIALVGIENWGLPPFPQYGDINKASADLDNNIFKVLMSHDPSHWDAQVLQHPTNFDLTLSGHTHGMQFGIEIPGVFKWSPVKFKYPRWAGLYEVEDKKLYVNRGFGFIGFPGRVGIWPEITQITLKCG